MIVCFRSWLSPPSPYIKMQQYSMLKMLGTKHLARSLLVLSRYLAQKRESQGAGALKDEHRTPQPRRPLKLIK